MTQTTISKVRKLEKRLSVREKALILAFTLVMLAIWVNSLTGRFGYWKRDHSLAQTELSSQQQYLDRADFFEQGLAAALERVDPAKTYSGTQLSGEIDNLLRRSGLSGFADIDPVRTREGEIFNDHNIRVKLNRISIAQMIEFNRLLSGKSPYINLQAVHLTANRRQPEQLNARLELNSFDLKEPQT